MNTEMLFSGLRNPDEFTIEEVQRLIDLADLQGYSFIHIKGLHLGGLTTTRLSGLVAN